jgi:hypothetical protein
MDNLEKLSNIRHILNIEINQTLDFYKKKYNNIKQEYDNTNLSDKLKQEKLSETSKEIDQVFKPYMKNILHYIDFSIDKDIVISNIIKHANILKEISNNSLIDKLINSKKDIDKLDKLGKYLPKDYLNKRKEQDAYNIYELIKKEYNSDEPSDINQSYEQESLDLPIESQIEKSIYKIDQPPTESTIEYQYEQREPSPDKVGAGLRNIYIEPRKIVGAHSSMGSNYGGHGHTHIGNHAVFFVIVILILFLLNILYTKYTNNVIEIDSDKHPQSPKIGSHKINLYRLDDNDTSSDSDTCYN